MKAVFLEVAFTEENNYIMAALSLPLGSKLGDSKLQNNPWQIIQNDQFFLVCKLIFTPELR